MSEEGRHWTTEILRFCLVFSLYFLTARLGLTMDAVSGFATLVWPPAGIALAALILFGPRYWAPIFLGAYTVNVVTGAPIWAALGIAFGNTMEAVVASFLLKKIGGFNSSMERAKDVAALVFYGAFLSPVISATIGADCLWLAHMKGFEGISATWRAWWTGDALGILVVTPPLLLWRKKFPRVIKFSQLLECLAMAGLLAFVGAVFFGGTDSILGVPNATFPYILFPFVVWAGLRFEQIGNVTVVLVIAIISVWATAHGRGPFSHGNLRENLFLLHSFLIVLSTSGLVLAVVVTERQSALKERDRAEEAEKFLIRASDILTGTLDYEIRLEMLARLALPNLADWCIVDVLDEDGSLRRVTAAHRDPLKEPLMQKLQEDYNPFFNSPQPAARVFQTGATLLLNNLSEAAVRNFCRDRKHFELMKQIGINSQLVVPLLFQGKMIGIFSLGRAGNGEFDSNEVVLIERLAKRAALAIDNSRLYSFAEGERAKLYSMFMQAPAAICILKGADHVFELVNPKARALLGDRDLTGLKFREAAPEFQEQNYFELLDEVYRSGRAVEMSEKPLRARREDGSSSEGFFNVVLQPWRDKRGRVSGILSVAIEVTDQVLARKKVEALAKMSATLGQSLEYEKNLAALTRLMVPELADWCAVDLLDDEKKLKSIVVTHKDPLKVNLAKDLHRRYPPDKNATSGAANVVRTGKSELYPVITDELIQKGAKDKDHGRLLRLLGLKSAMVVPLSSQGRTLGAITFISAESGRVYNSEDLAVAEEIGRRAGVAVENALLYRETQNSLALRDEFLSIASHELRTPLTSLYLQLQMIDRMLRKEGTGTVAADKLIRKIDVSENQAKQLGELIDNLLDMSRLGTHGLRISREMLNLTSVARSIAERFGENARKAGCQIIFHESPEVMVKLDRLRVTQALTNLISNAIKYGAGQPVEIAISTPGDVIQVIVQDHGIGVAAEDQSRIFERFERAVSHQNISGMGLGLYITREIAHAHGGRIYLESQPRQGAKFILEFPRQAPVEDHEIRELPKNMENLQ